MNIEKLAKHLKEFTLDEVEMIAECDCKTELEQLLYEGKLVFEQEEYKYVEKTDIQYDIFIIQNQQLKNIPFDAAVKYFLSNYTKKNCTDRTYKTYEYTFRLRITPYFLDKFINEISITDIQRYYKKLKYLELKPRMLKNTMALLNQLLRYFQDNGFIKKTCIFQVRRITAKNEFNLNRITFGGNYDQNEIL